MIPYWYSWIRIIFFQKRFELILNEFITPLQPRGAKLYKKIFSKIPCPNRFALLLKIGSLKNIRRDRRLSPIWYWAWVLLSTCSLIVSFEKNKLSKCIWRNPSVYFLVFLFVFFFLRYSVFKMLKKFVI